jgi:uncharacterized membrane protein
MINLINKIILLVLLTFVPTLELRWSIPIGVFSGEISTPFFNFVGFAMDPVQVFVIVVLANIALGPIAFILADKIVDVFTRINFINKLYGWWIKKVKKKQAFVDKYGVFAIIFFVGMPLPGSGSWGGAFSAKFLKVSFKNYLIGNTIGVLIAASIVMAISLGTFAVFGII